jgi:hypothetical protein
MDDIRICIFANFFIDNDERFKRMQDSFASFKDLNPTEWRINVRGRFKQQTSYFLKSEINQRLKLSQLDSKKGWLYDSLQIMNGCDSNYILFWVEDHICLVEPETLHKVCQEMEHLGADQCLYSFLHKKHTEIFQVVSPVKSGSLIDIWTIDKNFNLAVRQSLKRDFYVTSAVTITKINTFLKILRSNRPIFRRWPIDLPFDFEKKYSDRVINNFRYAIPKLELFASIDDDHGAEGYCLISRGHYPNNISRSELKRIEFRPNSMLENISQNVPKVKILFLNSITLNLINYLKRVKYSVDFIRNRRRKNI